MTCALPHVKPTLSRAKLRKAQLRSNFPFRFRRTRTAFYQHAADGWKSSWKRKLHINCAAKLDVKQKTCHVMEYDWFPAAKNFPPCFIKAFLLFLRRSLFEWMMDEACFTQSSTILFTLPTTLRLSFGSSFFHKSLFSVKREIFLFSFELSVGNSSEAFIGITYTFAKIMFMLEERQGAASWTEFSCW